jgi:flagellar basal-body rod protein FlgB
VIDATINGIEYALRGLTTRADVRADNVANAQTPGYRASAVEFETHLATALRGGGVPGVAPAVVNGDALPDPAGNTVDLETELVGLMKDNLMREAMVNAFNFKAGQLRTAIGGQ